MNTRETLVARVMKDAGRRIAMIDANAGVIAEAEAIAAAMNGQLAGKYTHTGDAVFSVTESSFSAWVQFSYVRRSDILAALCSLGLSIADEGAFYGETSVAQLTLYGLNVPVVIASPLEELAEVA